MDEKELKISMVSFVKISTQAAFKAQYDEYTKRNKWIPFGQWLGDQLDSIAKEAVKA